MDIPLDEVVYFDAITSNPTTGAAADADSTPTFAVYEEATDTDIGVGGNMTKRTSLTGNYRGSFTMSSANGFEVGKWYVVIVSATCSSVAGKARVMHFRCSAAESIIGKIKVDVDGWKGTAAATADTNGYPVVTIKDGTGQGELNITSGVVDAKLAAGVAHAGASLAITNDVAIGGNVETVGYVSIGGAFDVVGATTFTGAVTFTGAITGTNASNNLRINGVAPGASGGLLISGSNNGTTTLGALTVTGATTLTGAVSMGSTFGITGAATLASLTVSGATNLTGAVTLGSYLSIATDFGVGGDFDVTGAFNMGSALIAGATTLQGAVTASHASNSINLGTGAITAGVIAPDAIGASELATDAITEIQGAVQSALEANNLDHLVKIAVDTNFATTVHLDSVMGQIADNGTTATFDRTTDSLEAIRDNQSSGGGLTAAQTRDALGMAAADLDTQLDAILAATSASSGSGNDSTINITVNDGSTALQNAVVRLRQGINNYSATTGPTGLASFSVDNATYTLTITLSGYTFTPDTNFIVAGNASVTKSMTAITSPTPSSPDLCAVTGTLLEADGTALALTDVTFKLVSQDNTTTSGNVIQSSPFTATTDSNGAISIELVRTDEFDSGAYWAVTCPELRWKNKRMTLTSASFDLSDL